MWYRALAAKVDTGDEADARLDPKLRVPVLVLQSKPDSVFPMRPADHMKEFADNLTIEEVGALGHWVQLEAKDEVNSALKRFIESNS